MIAHTARFTEFYFGADGSTTDARIETRWTEIRKEAETLRAEFEAQGAVFSKVFRQPSSSLGLFRVVGHFKVTSAKGGSNAEIR